MKQGIVVVNHRTVDIEMRLRTIDDFVLSIGDRIEDADIVSAYTNSSVRKEIREITGEKIQNVKAAILGLKDRGATHLTVVSTGIAEDEEHASMMEEIRGLMPIFSEVKISKPLLSSRADYEITARAMKGAFSELVGDDILIVATNGLRLDEDGVFDGFEDALRNHFARSYVVTLKGEKKLYKAIKDLKASDVTSGRVVLVPLEFIAGNFIENELSGEYPDMVMRLIKEGYKVETPFKGLAEYDHFQRLYMRHLYEA